MVLGIPNQILYISLGVIVFLVVFFFIYRYMSSRKLQEKHNIQFYNEDENVFDTLKELENPKKKEIKLVAQKKIRDTKKAVKPEELQDEKFYYEAKPFEYFHRGKFSYRGWKDRRKARKFPDKVILIRMEMNNGRHREFLIKADAEHFVFEKQKYYPDISNRYYIVDSNIFAYDFHQALTLSVKNEKVLNPEIRKFVEQIEEDSKKGFKRKIDTEAIKETIEQSDISQIEGAVNPVVMERVGESQFVQMILQGATLGKLFKMLLILVIIILLVVAADMVIDLIDSGILEEINI